MISWFCAGPRTGRRPVGIGDPPGTALALGVGRLSPMGYKSLAG